MSGCQQKTFFPAAIITVTTVEPYELVIVANTTASTTLGLPDLSVTLKSETAVPSNLTAFSVTYYTLQGDVVPELRIEETPMSTFLAGNTTLVLKMSPYTSRVYNFLSTTNAVISPLKALIMLTFKDVNGNTVQKEVWCRIHSPS
ncbi:MAG: hypothetical protein HQM10_14215 [Candidatus Riflebacteria bacterium]|nr:hypothetical protein [Candidatus Riflebacteria bacterium]